jgi:hypothetical protein
MESEKWKIYGITEDEYIEYIRCLEKLEAFGFEELEANKNPPNCSTCIFCGNCTVTRENMFLGAKTC